ncbi:hypothetical protein C7451_11063 [Blastomonas natatoria]|uniref:Secreted protein n=1 Tax=Blastomonas natatoria TaxID=34015 RepID=A0A2V3UVE3_9SPHN|nr:hypothetical protein [Blastomonas natatoria]PXW73336.1 hypothetical protein C7451_11063 [Blastomonas natatoria]
MTRWHTPFALAPLLFALAGCATTLPAADPQAAFMASLAQHCGKAYPGRLVSTDPADADLVGKPMIVHFRACSANRMEIPFHVGTANGGWNRSRTWIITRTGTGLRLKHDHRHEDGSIDKVTQYGGDTASPGTPGQQIFPVDAESIAMFHAQGLGASVTNSWIVGIDARTYVYALRRPDGPDARNFRVEFDLTQPVAPPPAPWGW